MEGHTSFSSFSFLLALLTFSCFALGAHSTTKVSSEFIRSRCDATTYPQLCVDSLSSYAPRIHDSPVQLADAALSVSLSTVRSTSAMMSRLSVGRGRMSSKEAEAMSECIDGLGDSVEYLRDSMKEMSQMGVIKGREGRMKVNDVQTWVSTALTDESTCMDGFRGGGSGSMKSVVRGKIVNVARLTSNALALVSALASATEMASP